MTVVKNNPEFTETDNTEALEKDEQAEVVEETEEEEKEVEEEKVEETTEETNEETEEANEEVVPTKIKIGEQEFEEAALKEIVAKGTKIKEWEDKMPGFNVDTFMPDYTQKSQRLAAYEKRGGKQQQTVDSKELEELGIDGEQVKSFEKVAKHLGFVKQTDLVQDSVEAQKDAFIARHSEYAPGSPVNDAKWGKLIEEFNFYDWKNNPERVEKFLERAHADVSKTWQEAERGGKVQETITTKTAQAKVAAMGGVGGGKGAPAAQKSSNTALADKYRAMGWTEEDIKEVLI